MALDGITIAAVAASLKAVLIGGRVDKAVQPERDEANLVIRSGGANRRLLLSANASHPRAHFTETVKENPPQAPMFCMILRKHVVGGRIVGVEQNGFERDLNIFVESASEMGDVTTKTIHVEIMGKHSNVILVGQDGFILDAVKRVSREMSSVREVSPGLAYTPPPSQGKLDPTALTAESFAALFDSAANAAVNVQKLIYGGYSGISPVIAAEICHRAAVPADTLSPSLGNDERNRLFNAFAALMEQVKRGAFEPEIVFDGGGKPVDFAAVPLTMFGEGYSRRRYDDVSAMLEDYYAERDKAYHVAQKVQDLRRAIAANVERTSKKVEIHQKTISDAAGRDKWKLFGELLTANIYMVEKGAERFSCQNFYDENLASVDIPLDPSLTPAENAQRYFKRYNKEKRAAAASEERLREAEEELTYLISVQHAANTAETAADIDDIRGELAEQGFVKRKNNTKGGKKPKSRKSAPLEFTSGDGFMVLVGKSNTQNDELTMKTADGGDIWLHAKDIPGSHVVVRTGGKTPPDATIEFAAGLAAYYSKARESLLVPVDFCPRKNVKKPNGARPGFVIYENYRTAYVKPTLPKY